MPTGETTEAEAAGVGGWAMAGTGEAARRAAMAAAETPPEPGWMGEGGGEHVTREREDSGETEEHRGAVRFRKTYSHSIVDQRPTTE